MGRLPLGMDAAVGSSGSGDPGSASADFMEGLFKNSLDGALSFLPLPAGEMGPIVGDSQLEERLLRRYAPRNDAISSSAIWTAFKAAPLRRLSETIQQEKAFLTKGSGRTRPMKTSSRWAASIGIG